MPLSQNARPGGEGARMEAAYRDMVMFQTHPVVLLIRRRRLLRWNWYHSFQKSTLGTGEEASPSVCVCVRRHHRSSPGRWRLMTCYSCYTVLPIPTPSSPSRPELRQPSQWRRFLHVHRDSEFSEFGFRHHTVRKKYGLPNAPLPVKYATGYTVWSTSGIVMSAVCPSVCNAEHCGFQGRCTGLKGVPACS